jgi:hypothetical protein
VQEFDTIIVEGDSSMQHLRFSRIPAPTEEADSEGGTGTPKAGASSSSQQKQQPDRLQPVQPIPVIIPGAVRHVNSFGRMAAGSVGAAKPPVPAVTAAAGDNSKGGSNSSSLKYDPLASRKKGGKAPAAQQQPAQPAGPALNGSRAAAAEGNGAAGLQQQGSSSSLDALIAGLDANVASHLDPANLPAFLRTPERRDGEGNLPTQSW